MNANTPDAIPADELFAMARENDFGAQHTPDYDKDDQFVCTDCGHSCNCIDEVERPRDECPVCGNATLISKAARHLAAEPSIAGNPLFFTGIENYTLVNSPYVCHAKSFATAEAAAAAIAPWNRLGHKFAVVPDSAGGAAS